MVLTMPISLKERPEIPVPDRKLRPVSSEELQKELEEEAGDFIARLVLEKDLALFEG